MPAGLFTTARSESSNTMSKGIPSAIARDGGSDAEPSTAMRSPPRRRKDALAFESSAGIVRADNKIFGKCAHLQDNITCLNNHTPASWTILRQYNQRRLPNGSGGHRPDHPATQPPDQTASYYQTNRDQLRAGHDP